MIVHILNNVTDQFQPLDLNVNGDVKELLKVKFEFLYVQHISNQLEGGSSVYNIQVPLKVSVIKPIHTKCLLGFYDHLRNSSDTIIKEFTMTGIKDVLMMELPLEDLFASLDA